MTQQYAIHAGNAINALDKGELDIVRRQIRLAQLASKNRLEAKRQQLMQQAAGQAKAAAQPPAATIASPARHSIGLPRIDGHISLGSRRTQYYLLLLTWSMGIAMISNNLIGTSVITTAVTAAPAPWSTNPVSGLPVDGRITSGIGWRTHPVTGKRSYHAGQDIAAPAGTPIHATGAGTVLFAGWRNNNCGNGVIIHHGDRKTIYCHMQKIADGIREGATLPPHAVIGYIGHTGRATGDHVHYEIQPVRQAHQQTGGKQATGQYQQHINTAARKFGVDPLLVKSVVWKESSFDATATSRSGAMGLMQLMPETAQMQANKLKMQSPDLYDPETNIRLGTAYLADLIRQFGRLDHALAAYNAGPGAVRKHRGIPPYPETRAYVTKITGYYNNLKKEN